MENDLNLLPVGFLLNNGRYRIEQHLGSGGFGNTYRVLDTTNGKMFALKEFYLKGVNERDANSRIVSVSNADNTDEFESQRSKFRKESMRLQTLDNPHVVHVYQLFEENGTTYYVMDFLEGESLSARMKRQGHPFSEDEVLDMTRQILIALDTVHRANIWHLDLKPGNIMTAGDGHLVLIDFGASKQFHDSDGRSLSTSTGLCYTPGYAPTEQIAGEASRMGPWTDLYALGATVYNLLTMETPPSVSAIQDGEAFHFPPSVSSKGRRLVTWLMEPNRNQRPQSVSAVQRFLDPPEVATVVANTDESDDEDEADGGNRTMWYVIGGVVAVAAVVALFLLTKGKNHAVIDEDDEYDDEVEMAMKTDDDWYAKAYADSVAFADSMAMVERDAARAAERRSDSIRRAREDNERQARAEEQRREEQRQTAQAPVGTFDATANDNVESVSEEQTVSQNDTRVYDVVEQMPQYPGGDAALMQYLSSHIKYPVIAEENGIQGRVVCTFVVERDGSITNIVVVKSVDPSLDKEAIRVIKSMPKWIPGKKNGSPVRVKYNVPVTFRLQ